MKLSSFRRYEMLPCSMWLHCRYRHPSSISMKFVFRVTMPRFPKKQPTSQSSGAGSKWVPRASKRSGLVTDPAVHAKVDELTDLLHVRADPVRKARLYSAVKSWDTKNEFADKYGEEALTAAEKIIKEAVLVAKRKGVKKGFMKAKVAHKKMSKAKWIAKKKALWAAAKSAKAAAATSAGKKKARKA